jgi:hypothetical protein
MRVQAEPAAKPAAKAGSRRKDTRPTDEAELTESEQEDMANQLLVEQLTDRSSSDEAGGESSGSTRRGGHSSSSDASSRSSSGSDSDSAVSDVHSDVCFALLAVMPPPAAHLFALQQGAEFEASKASEVRCCWSFSSTVSLLMAGVDVCVRASSRWLARWCATTTRIPSCRR